MKLLITGLLVLLASVAITLLVREDNGYVLIGYGHWTIEGSLAFVILLDLLLFVALYLGLRTLVRLWGLPHRVQIWTRHRRARRARQSLNQGLVELAEGRWGKAEKSLTRYAGLSETPLLNYLAAARAAQQQGAYERRDHYLQRAHESMPEADVAVGLTQAELQIAHDQNERALATLMHLRQVAPRHAHVLKLLKRLYQQLGDWQSLRELLPALKRGKAIPPEEYAALEVQVFQRLLEAGLQGSDSAQLSLLWQDLPKPLREHRQLLETYVQRLIELGSSTQAGELLREILSRQWDPRLVEHYGMLQTDGPGEQLTTAESWLADHPRDPVLLLTLGRLALRTRLWGKARSYLEASIGAEPSADAYRELGLLLERINDRQGAFECYRKGLELTSHTTAAVMASELPTRGEPARLEGRRDIAPPVPSKALAGTSSSG